MDGPRSDGSVVEIEVIAGGPEHGGFLNVWHVEPPEIGATFRVADYSWHDDYTIRRIYAWEPAEAEVVQ